MKSERGRTVSVSSQISFLTNVRLFSLSSIRLFSVILRDCAIVLPTIFPRRFAKRSQDIGKHKKEKEKKKKKKKRKEKSRKKTEEEEEEEENDARVARRLVSNF